MDWSGPGGPRGPQPPLVDQEPSGPPWTTLRHFPDVLRVSQVVYQLFNFVGVYGKGFPLDFSQCFDLMFLIPPL